MLTQSGIRILIADDQAIVRQGLEVILGVEPDLHVVGAAANGGEAVALAAALQPDVVLMDLKMPKMNGIHATRRIAQELPAVKVLVLTTYDGDEWLFDALRAGACGYLLKDSDSDAIVAAIRGAVAGEVHLDPHVAGKVLHEFNRVAANQPLPLAKPTAPMLLEPLYETLSERELAVLQELAQGKSNQEIAATLFLAEGTVKNYVSTIMAKLHANDRTQAAIYALKRGLVRLD
jgi:DNA-binding NarL/FixJ family response regulator